MTTVTRLLLAILVLVASGAITACASSASGLRAGPDATSGAHTAIASPSPSVIVTHAPVVAATAATSAQARDVEVTARDFSFTPAQLDIPAVGTTRIVLRNQGFVVHNLTVDALEIQAVAPRGGVAEVTLTDPPPGTYEFYCSVSGHREAGMTGTLVVRP